MSILRIGPDGMVIVYALIMSVIVAVLSWRRVTLARASTVLLAASRVNWLAQRAWLFILVGPIAFVGCYLGICEICYSANLV